MTNSSARQVVRGLSLLPAIVAVLCLVLAGMVAASLFHVFVWWHLLLFVAFAGYAVYLFRRAYLCWRRPSRIVVQETCGWLVWAFLALAAFVIGELDSAGHTRLATGAAWVGLPLLATIYFWLTRTLVRTLFTTD